MYIPSFWIFTHLTQIAWLYFQQSMNTDHWPTDTHKSLKDTQTMSIDLHAE